MGEAGSTVCLSSAHCSLMLPCQTLQKEINNSKLFLRNMFLRTEHFGSEDAFLRLEICPNNCASGFSDKMVEKFIYLYFLKISTFRIFILAL